LVTATLYKDNQHVNRRAKQHNMNPTLLLASIAAAIIGSAQAGYIYIYSPYAATQCQPGTPCAISWNVAQDGPQFNRVDIELLAGDAQTARVVAPIALGYDLSQGNSYLWNVPQSIIPEGDYFIRMKGVGTDYQSYSHSFPIGFEPRPHPHPHPTGTATGTETATATGTATGTATASRSISVRSSVTAKTTAASSSSAMSVQGSVSVAAAIAAAAFALMMF
jgi:hypothetical protein